MNYIRHLNGFFERLALDARVTAYHVSLYMALFQLWNMNRFSDSFQVNRSELMIMSRICSVNTYAKCMRELHDWEYIHYSSSGNGHMGSRVSCIRFDTGRNTGNHTTSDTSNGTGDNTLLNKRINNKEDKQMPHNFSSKKAGKNFNGKSHYHVQGNKDYSEPL